MGIQSAASDTDRPPEVEAALRWLARASLPISALEEPSTVSRALDACGRKLDGSAAAAHTTGVVGASSMPC